MARESFGGATGDFLYRATGSRLLRLEAATMRLWDAETGGTRVTDLLLDGAPVTEIPVGESGDIPTFEGPDGVVGLWAEAGGARRLLTARADSIFAETAAARDETIAARDEAEAFGGTNDGIVEGLVTDPASATGLALRATIAPAFRPTSLRVAPSTKLHAKANVAGHGWAAGTGNTATLTLNDTTYKPTGTQSIKAVTDGSGGPARVDATGLTLDLTGEQPVVWVSVDDVAKLNGLSLYLGATSAFSAYFLWQFAPRMNGLFEFKSGEFVKIVLNWQDATVVGSPDRSALTAARFYAQDQSTGAATVRFSGLGSQPEPAPYPKGLITFTCDDSRISQWTKMKPSLDRYGYPATAYTIAGRVDSDVGTNWLTTTQLQAMQNESGWEIAAHAYSQALHDQVGGYTAATSAEIAADFAAMKRWLADRGLFGADHIAYPQGLFDDHVLAATRQFFTSGRNVFFEGAKASLESWPPADPYRMRSIILSSAGTASLANVKALVDKAVAGKGWLNITVHALGATADSLTWVDTDFDLLVDYIAASGAAVRTVGAALSGAQPATSAEPPAVQLDTFAATGTWTKPAGAKWHEVFLVGSGAGGGSGRRGAGGTNAFSGAGGGGGARALGTFASSALGATEPVAIGAAGVGGAAVTTDDTDGNPGTAAADTTFGNPLAASGRLRAKGGAAGAGGTAAAAAAGAGGAGQFAGAAGGAGTSAGGGSAVTATGGGGGGAGGGGLSAGNAAGAGGFSAFPHDSAVTGNIAGGANTGVAGTTPQSRATGSAMGGAGGSGGGANLTGAAGAGGNGASYGGGGAGGGASRNGNASGKGGDGAPGFALIVTHF